MSVEEVVSRRARAAASRIYELEEALKDATAHLAGAASAYRKHASRHMSQGRAISDPMFSTRAADFDRAVERARLALNPNLSNKG